jgi:hypothetical protein
MIGGKVAKPGYLLTPLTNPDSDLFSSLSNKNPEKGSRAGA